MVRIVFWALILVGLLTLVGVSTLHAIAADGANVIHADAVPFVHTMVELVQAIADKVITALKS